MTIAFARVSKVIISFWVEEINKHSQRITCVLHEYFFVPYMFYTCVMPSVYTKFRMISTYLYSLWSYLLGSRNIKMFLHIISSFKCSVEVFFSFLNGPFLWSANAEHCTAMEIFWAIECNVFKKRNTEWTNAVSYLHSQSILVTVVYPAICIA